MFLLKVTVDYSIHPSLRARKSTASSDLPWLSHQSPVSVTSSPNETNDDITFPETTDLATAIHQKANQPLSQTIRVLDVLYTELKDKRLQPPSRSGLAKAKNAVGER